MTMTFGTFVPQGWKMELAGIADPAAKWAATRGMELEHLTVTRPTLEDVYLDLTEEAA